MKKNEILEAYVNVAQIFFAYVTVFFYFHNIGDIGT